MATTRCESTVRAADGRVVIGLRGDIDAGARDELTAAYDAAVAAGDGPLVLDLSEVSYINSTGIALIVGVLGRARADGRTLAACGLSEHYREIFTITRLSDFIAIYPDVADAPAGDGRE